MKNFVINIGRQLGSGGKPIGEIVARRLGVRIYDRSLIDLAARQSGLCPEVFARADEREAKGVFATLVGYLRAPFTGYEGGNAANVLSNEALFQMQSDAIREVAARESCLFVGRCADYILRNEPLCISTFIYASEADRIARIMRCHGAQSPKEAIDMMRKIDKKRAAYYDFYTDKSWGAATSYDLCIDSSVLGIDRTAELLRNYTEQRIATAAAQSGRPEPEEPAR